MHRKEDEGRRKGAERKWREGEKCWNEVERVKRFRKEKKAKGAEGKKPFAPPSELEPRA